MVVALVGGYWWLPQQCTGACTGVRWCTLVVADVRWRILANTGERWRRAAQMSQGAPHCQHSTALALLRVHGYMPEANIHAAVHAKVATCIGSSGSRQKHQGRNSSWAGPAGGLGFLTSFRIVPTSPQPRGLLGHPSDTNGEILCVRGLP